MTLTGLLLRLLLALALTPATMLAFDLAGVVAPLWLAFPAALVAAQTGWMVLDSRWLDPRP